MRVALCIAVICLALPSSAQSVTPVDDFSLTLEHTGCLGNCPDCKVTIQSDGRLRYEGRGYVHVVGIREKKIPFRVLQRLEQVLHEEDFFNWKPAGGVCLDTPETYISAILNGARNHVTEGCNVTGKVLKLAKEIEKITGV